MLIQFVERNPEAEHGAAACGRDVMRALLGHGHRVLVRSLGPWTPPDEWAERFGDRIRSVPIADRPGRLPPPPSRRWPSEARRWARSVVGWLRASRQLGRIGRPELTIVNSLGTHDAWVRIDRPERGPAAVVVQESPRHFLRDGEQRAGHARSWQRTLGWAVGVIKSYDACIFASARCREEWLDLAPGLRERPTFAIPNTCNEPVARSFDGADRAELRRGLGWPEGRFVAACIASIQHRKGQDLLVERLDELFRAVPGLFLVLVGPRVEGPWTDRLLATIEASPHRGDVLVMPARPHAMDVIRAADAVVLPSRAEAMPVVLLEAMFLGTPILATDVDGIPELIVDGDSGLLVSVDRPDRIVSGLAKMAASPADRAEMAGRARRRYEDSFRVELLGHRYDEAVRAIVGSVVRPAREPRRGPAPVMGLRP